MLPQTFLSLRAFGPALVDQLTTAFAAQFPAGVVPVAPLLAALQDLELPSAANGDGSDDADAGGLADLDALDVIGFTEIGVAFDGSQLVVSGTLDVLEGFEPTLPLPGLPELALVVTQLGKVRITVTPDKAALELTGPSLALRFDRSWLAPANPESTYAFAEIELAEIGWFTVDTTGAMQWGALPGGELRFVTNNDPWRIGDSSVTLETGTLRISLENGPVVELDEATLRFSDDLTTESGEGFALVLTGARIDRHGFTGSASARFDDTHLDVATGTYLGSGAGSLFDLAFGVYAIEIDIQRNVPVRAEVRGGMVLPFFDSAVDCTVALGRGGEFEIALAGAGGGALARLTKEGLLELALTGFAVSRVDKVTTFTISGSLEFENGPGEMDDGSMPKFTVQNLSVNSKGQVRLEKAWVDFNPALSADLVGFTLTLYRVGIAFQDGDVTVFITGVVALANGLPQAGVEELSITFPRGGGAPQLSLTGLSIDATLGGQIKFYGRFALLNSGGQSGFEGDLALTLIKPGLAIEGSLKAGHDARGFSFLYIYVAVELPVGIVVGPNVAIFGFAGLFGHNVRPSRQENQHWYYDWYRGPPGPGITQSSKWAPAEGKWAFGAGITFGTADGYTIAARALFVVTSDLLLIEGRAGFLTERTNLGQNPALRMLVVFEPGVSLFIAIEAQYEFVANVLFAQGVIEAFFPFNDGDWFVHLGKDDPPSKRIVADVLKKLFRADAYVMIDAEGVRFGGQIGYGLNKKFGPVRVEVCAGISATGQLSFSPIQFDSTLTLYGKLKLRAFGAGLTVSLDSTIGVRIYRPFELSMDFHAKMSLPWPLPDPEVDFTIKWKREGTPAYPTIVTGAASMSNIGTKTIELVAGDHVEGVPLDGRIALTFAHAVKKSSTSTFTHLLALPQRNAHVIDPSHTFRYAVETLTLERFDGSPNPVETFDLSSGNSPIWASWQILDGLEEPENAESATKQAPGGSLLLMARSPFSWVKNSWNQGWNGIDAPVAIPTYTAVPVPEANETTIDLCTFWTPDGDWTPSDGETALGTPDPTLPTNTTTPSGAVVVVRGFPEPGSENGGPTVFTDPTDKPFGISIEFPEPVDITEITVGPEDGTIVITDGDKPGREVPPADRPEPEDKPTADEQRCRRCCWMVVGGWLLTALAMLVLLLFALGRTAPRMPRTAWVYIVLILVLALIVTLVWLWIWRRCCSCCGKFRWRWPPWRRRVPGRDPREDPWAQRQEKGEHGHRRRVAARAPESDEANRRRARRAGRVLRSRRFAEIGIAGTGDKFSFVGKRLECGSISWIPTAEQEAHDDAVATNAERAAYATSFPQQVGQMFEDPAFILVPGSRYRLTCAIRKSDKNAPGPLESRWWEFTTQPTAPRQLAPYVFENVPAGIDVPHWRSAPIGVVLSENYVQRMYVTAAETPIELVVADSAGVVQGTRSFAWRTSPWHIDREGEAAFVAAVQDIYGSAFGAEIPGDDVLVSYANDPATEAGALAPDAVFDAYVRFEGDASAESPLHITRFRTSRFRDLAHWAEGLNTAVTAHANPGVADATWDTPGIATDAWTAAEAPFDTSVLELIEFLKEPLPPAPTLRVVQRHDGRNMLILTAPEPLPWQQISLVVSTLPAIDPGPPPQRQQVAVPFADAGPRQLGLYQNLGPMNQPASPYTRLLLSASVLDLVTEADVDEATGIIPAQVVEMNVRWMADGTRAFLTPADPAELLDDAEYDLEIRFMHRIPNSAGECVIDVVARRLAMP